MKNVHWILFYKVLHTSQSILPSVKVYDRKPELPALPRIKIQSIR